jgi:hypothetical protein
MGAIHGRWTMAKASLAGEEARILHEAPRPRLARRPDGWMAVPQTEATLIESERYRRRPKVAGARASEDMTRRVGAAEPPM